LEIKQVWKQQWLDAENLAASFKNIMDEPHSSHATYLIAAGH
jgi:hypothetical protein